MSPPHRRQARRQSETTPRQRARHGRRIEKGSGPRRDLQSCQRQRPPASATALTPTSRRLTATSHPRYAPRTSSHQDQGSGAAFRALAQATAALCVDSLGHAIGHERDVTEPSNTSAWQPRNPANKRDFGARMARAGIEPATPRFSGLDAEVSNSPNSLRRSCFLGTAARWSDCRYLRSFLEPRRLAQGCGSPATRRLSPRATRRPRSESGAGRNSRDKR